MRQAVEFPPTAGGCMKKYYLFISEKIINVKSRHNLVAGTHLILANWLLKRIFYIDERQFSVIINNNPNRFLLRSFLLCHAFHYLCSLFWSHSHMCWSLLGPYVVFCSYYFISFFAHFSMVLGPSCNAPLVTAAIMNGGIKKNAAL